jgi:hypothetical protein
LDADRRITEVLRLSQQTKICVYTPCHFGSGHYSTLACFTLRRFGHEFVVYPSSTLLGGIRSWSLRDRLSFPLHGLMVSRYRGEGAFTFASKGQESHLYVNQVINKLSSIPDLNVISEERVAPGDYER